MNFRCISNLCAQSLAAAKGGQKFPAAVALTLAGTMTLSLSACGEKQQTPPPPAQPTPAQIQQAEVEKRIAEQKAKREAEAKAKAEAAAAKQAKIEAIAVAPDPLPKRLKLPKACGKLAKTYDEFMHRLYTGHAIEQWDGGAKKMQLAMTKKSCMAQNVAVALCQSNALSKATEDIKKEVPAIFKTCVKKYGKAAGGK